MVALYTLLWRPSVHLPQDQNTSEILIEPENTKPPATSPPVPVPIPISLGADEVTIGRQDDNTIILSHPQVSGIHARLINDDGVYRIIDPGSTYHVYVNGQRVINQVLNINDEIRIGPFKFIYTETELLQYDESKSIRIDALHLQKFGKIGGMKGAISRLLRTIADRLPSLREFLKKHSKRRVILGNFARWIYNDVALLNDISLTIPPGQLIALLGGSGAGKSTLMDALNGFRQADLGTVLYNGEDYYKSLASFRTLIGYVPQDDIVHRELTVDRALYYAAKIRLPKDFTEQQIMQRINEVLQEVKMTEHREKIINKLSGGQRKRVSIALELLTKPTIFFLDEPTSGLDPGLDDEIMRVLWKLSHDHGHTIVLVTHNVNDIHYCDSVCFLAPGGYLAYVGPRKKMWTYFRTKNVPEIYNNLEPTQHNPNSAKDAADRFKNSQWAQINAQNAQVSSLRQRAKLPKLGNRRKQFWLLSMRYLELLRNDIGNLAILLFQAPIIGLLLLLFIKGVGPDGFNPNNVVQCPTTAMVISAAGYPDLPTPTNPVVSKSCQHLEHFLSNNPRGKVYASKRGGTREALQDFIEPGPGYAPTVLFIMAFSAIMFGCINAAREFVKEVHIYRRERSVNLGIVPYMFSKIAVLGLLCLLQSLILVVFVNIFDPFSHSVFLLPFLEVYITIALTSLAGLMMGLAVSALVPNNDRAMSFVPLLLIPQVIFSGTIFPLNSWLLQSLGALFPIRWAMAALGSSVGLHSDKLNGDQLFGDIYTYHGTLFSTYTQADATYYLWLIWLALGIMIIIFAIAIGFFLKRKDAYR
ncbi:MAG: ATP-binding cassette domain-containing protein [Ktedonobacteraceae bacterium]